MVQEQLNEIEEFLTNGSEFLDTARLKAEKQRSSKLINSTSHGPSGQKGIGLSVWTLALAAITAAAAFLHP